MRWIHSESYQRQDRSPKLEKRSMPRSGHGLVGAGRLGDQFPTLWFASLMLLALVAGCAGGPPEPKPLPLQFVAAPDLNARKSGEGQNVDVMVVQLVDLDTFSKIDLLDLYPTKAAAEAALGSSLLSISRYQFTPDEKRTLELQVDPKARFLGVVVAYEQYQIATWRASLQLQDDTLKDKMLFRNKQVKVALGSLTVAMQLEK